MQFKRVNDKEPQRSVKQTGQWSFLLRIAVDVSFIYMVYVFI